MTIEGLQEMQEKLADLKHQKYLIENILGKCNDMNVCSRLREKLETINLDILFYEYELDID